MTIHENCQSCGTNWRDHLGISGTCARCLAWESMARELAAVLNQEVIEEQDKDRVLGNYERLKFFQRR
jgi:predicted ATP-dependent serine protease